MPLTDSPTPAQRRARGHLRPAEGSNFNRQERDHASHFFYQHPAAPGDAVDVNVQTQEEIGHAQVACRAENEAIQASADRLTILGSIPFVCECPSQDCSEIVRLSFDEYEAIRQYPRRFFNVSGHEAASVEAGAERILAVVGDLTVVEKIGIAGDLAADAHRPIA